MLKCPQCGAPNNEARTNCYSCNGILRPVQPAQPPPQRPQSPQPTQQMGPFGAPQAPKPNSTANGCVAAIVLVIFFAILYGLMSPGGSSTSGSSSGYSGSTASSSDQPSLVGFAFVQGGYSGEIIGTVRNSTNRTFGYAQVEFNVYDASGSQVGSAMDNINNLEPGGTWKFKAMVLERSATSARFKGISAF